MLGVNGGGMVWTNQEERGNYTEGDIWWNCSDCGGGYTTPGICQNSWNYEPKSTNFIVCKLKYKFKTLNYKSNLPALEHL